MKRKIFNNFGYKIAAVIIAFVLWLTVVNVSDYSVTKQINDIPVTQLNGEALEELDKIYDVKSGGTVDIIVKGRRSVVSGLGVEDFVATADLSQMSITNTVQIFVEPKSKTVADDISITCVNNTMSLNLEEKVSVQFPVKIKTTGETAEGYAIGETYAAPNIITVEGPESTIEKITEVVAVVPVTNASNHFEAKAQIELYDAYGSVITNDKVSISQKEVVINVKVYPVKTVNINVEVKGTPEDGYAIADVIYQPQAIDIAGAPELLAGIENIVINDISVSGLAEDLQTTVDIKDKLIEGIFVASDSSEIVITVAIEKKEEKAFELTDKNVTLQGKNSKYKYTLKFTEGCVLVASGISSALENVTITDIAPTVDCTKLNEGTYNNVDLEFQDIDGVTYEIEGKVNLEISTK